MSSDPERVAAPLAAAADKATEAPPHPRLLVPDSSDAAPERRATYPLDPEGSPASSTGGGYGYGCCD
ncbi:hypothetical protein KBD61_05370 [Patescibacteria group bacterium]|nr:hypothetical protein [Patescibacteria group bacterium]MBP9710420.1 hypothetical protein [Patescibacteria group bacterium]